MTKFISNRLRNYHKPEILSGLLCFAITGLAALALTSCGGGGGGGGGGGSTAVTITSISRPGIVQATPYSLSIYGTNFVNGMTLSITSSNPTVTITPTSITSGLITANVNISTAPAERYVTINILSNGSSVASTIMGVASSNQVLQSTGTGYAPATTDIQNILNIYCRSCHGASGNLNMSTNTLSSNNLINTYSTGTYKCANKFRVVAGDPRTTSSFLIDKLTNATPCGGGVKMPTGTLTTPFTQTEIDAITDWVAGGAR